LKISLCDKSLATRFWNFLSHCCFALWGFLWCYRVSVVLKVI